MEEEIKTYVGKFRRSGAPHLPLTETRSIMKRQRTHWGTKLVEMLKAMEAEPQTVVQLAKICGYSKESLILRIRNAGVAIERVGTAVRKIAPDGKSMGRVYALYAVKEASPVSYQVPNE